MRTCYYELLGVEFSATADELKKAYRKQALVWHPDKNADRLDLAHEQFTLIGEAYNVLSDPHERAWYDSHRDAILRGDDNNGESSSSVNRDTTAGTTVDELMRYFTSLAYSGYSDSNKGFYSVFHSLFQKLDTEEENASRLFDPDDSDNDSGSESRREYNHYPAFGTSTTPFIDSPDSVRNFYNAWLNFSTLKSFRWLDRWRLSEAPNRRTKRVMEKENRKARELGRREYNDAIRNLVAFVRKRDPRHKAFQEAEKARKQAQAAETKARLLREREAAAGRAAVYEEPEWAKVNNVVVESESEDEEEENEFYCVACKKSFKSERQWANHEKSKKHVKIVEGLRKEMLADEVENDIVDTDEDGDAILEDNEDIESAEPSLEGSRTSSPLPPPQASQDALEALEDDGDLPSETLTPSSSKKVKKKKKNVPRFGYDEDFVSSMKDPSDAENLSELLDLYANVSGGRRAKAKKGRSEKGLASDGGKEANGSTETTVVPADNEDESKLSGKQKHEQRREKKKKVEENQTKCNICDESFPTRNQLFSHIKSTGHAVVIPGAGGAKKKR